MSKLYAIAVVIVVLAGAYLFLAYVHIYHTIGNAHLTSPDISHSYTISGPPTASKTTYVSLGDSLTAGVGAETYMQSYPYMFAKQLSRKNTVNLKDLSYPGAKTQDVIATLPDAIARKPDIVTLLIGINDIHDRITAAQFEANYRSILSMLKKNTTAKIYAISIPFIGSRSLLLPPYNYYFEYKTEEFNDIIRRLADGYAIKYVDIATPTRFQFKKDGPLYSADSFHPSAAGYKLWSDILYADTNR